MDADRDAELSALRLVLMSTPTLRASAEAVVYAILRDTVDLDDDDEAPDWIVEAHGEPLTMGELRSRLRVTLTEIAVKD